MKAVSCLPWGLSHLDHSFTGNFWLLWCLLHENLSALIYLQCADHFPLLDYHPATWRRLVLHITIISLSSANCKLEERFIKKGTSSVWYWLFWDMCQDHFLIPSLGRMKPALNWNISTCSWGSYSTNAEGGYLGKTKELKMCFDSFTLCVMPLAWGTLCSPLDYLLLTFLYSENLGCLLTSLCFARLF